jgi:hypothetical protein
MVVHHPIPSGRPDVQMWRGLGKIAARAVRCVSSSGHRKIFFAVAERSASSLRWITQMSRSAGHEGSARRSTATPWLPVRGRRQIIRYRGASVKCTGSKERPYGDTPVGGALVKDHCKGASTVASSSANRHSTIGWDNRRAALSMKCISGSGKKGDQVTSAAVLIFSGGWTKYSGTEIPCCKTVMTECTGNRDR